MSHDPEKYLFDMLGACEFLLGFTKGRTVEDYRSDRAFRSAIERELQIVGEALLQLDRIHPERASRIDPRKSEHHRVPPCLSSWV